MRAPAKQPSKSTIDRVRNSAGSARIPDGMGNIAAMTPFGGRLYFIAEYGVSSAVTADQIDPERTNINLPQFVQQVEFEYGASSSFVQRTVCAAFELFQETYLPEPFARDRALELAMEVGRNLAGISDLVRDLKQHQLQLRSKIATGEVKASHLPRMPNVNGHCGQGIAQLRFIQTGMMELIQLFYPKAQSNDKWDKRLREAAEAIPSEDQELGRHLNHALAALKRFADYRSALIHPSAEKRVRVWDYELTREGEILAPTLEVVHPDSPALRQDVAQFFEFQIDDASVAFEAITVALCYLNRSGFGEIFENMVVQLAEDERRNGSRFVWHTEIKEGYTFPPQQG